MFCFSYSFVVVHCCAKSQICNRINYHWQDTFFPFSGHWQEEITPIKNLLTEHFISPMYRYVCMLLPYLKFATKNFFCENVKKIGFLENHEIVCVRHTVAKSEKDCEKDWRKNRENTKTFMV